MHNSEIASNHQKIVPSTCCTAVVHDMYLRNYLCSFFSFLVFSNLKFLKKIKIKIKMIIIIILYYMKVYINLYLLGKITFGISFLF